MTLKVNGTQSCTATTNATASPPAPSPRPSRPGTYSVSGSFSGDTTTRPVLLSSTGSNTFTETKAPTTLTYTGSTSATSGHTPTLSATLTTRTARPSRARRSPSPWARAARPSSCTAPPTRPGTRAAASATTTRTPARCPVTVTYGGQQLLLVVEHLGLGDRDHPDLALGQRHHGHLRPEHDRDRDPDQLGQRPSISGQTITLTLNGSQTCTATTASYGQGFLHHHADRAVGDLPVSGTFAGNTAPRRSCSAATAPTTSWSTGRRPTSATRADLGHHGQSLTLSTTLTSNGTPLSSQPVTLTLGTGRSAQSCTATTNSSGSASCTIQSVNQVSGTVAVTVSYAGNGYYAASSTSGGVSPPLRRWQRWRWRRQPVRRWRVRGRLLRAPSSWRRRGCS